LKIFSKRLVSPSKLLGLLQGVTKLALSAVVPPISSRMLYRLRSIPSPECAKLVKIECLDNILFEHFDPKQTNVTNKRRLYEVERSKRDNRSQRRLGKTQ
jgi:hypothetical protein